MIIPGANGLVNLSIPVIGGRSVKLAYKDVLIDYSADWQRDHLRTILSVYGKSAWGIHYFDSLETLYSRRKKYLFDWNMSCLEWLCTKLKIQIEIKETGISGEKHSILDLTDAISPSNYMSFTSPGIEYFQVFEDRLGFQTNMSCIDLLMNEGAVSASKYL